MGQLQTDSAAPPNAAVEARILGRARQLVGTPYVWGGNSARGLDCSAFVSRAWGISRQTSETLAQHAHAVSANDLRAGDALNLTAGRDPEGLGHVRLFDRWADESHTHMWVYEATPPSVIHHVVPFNHSYQPLRFNGRSAIAS